LDVTRQAEHLFSGLCIFAVGNDAEERETRSWTETAKILMQFITVDVRTQL